MRALALPSHPERPIWDRYFPQGYGRSSGENQGKDAFLTLRSAQHIARRMRGSLSDSIARQLRCPTGRWGRITGRVMAVANRQPTHFAIEALRVQTSDIALELGFGAGQGIKATSRPGTPRPHTWHRSLAGNGCARPQR